MGNFRMFFPMGIQHITDFQYGIDHILFIAALCLRYLWTDWKKLLVLVTAFTIGHSITLALSTLDVISLPRNWTEFLIPVTIVITAFNNCFVTDFKFNSKYPTIYFFALFFGLIHGLGFSTLLKSMLGKNTSIISQLFAFNLGLEVGQLLIVCIILLFSFLLVRVLQVNRREFILFVSGGIAALALQMAIDRFPIKNEHSHEKTAFVCGSRCNHLRG